MRPLGSQSKPGSADETVRSCQGCGTALPPNKAPGRARKWCSAKCRKAQYGGACIGCGTRTDGSNGRAKAPERCVSCRAHMNDERNERIARAFEAGDPTSEIARREGMTEDAVLTLVDWLRRVKGKPVARRYREHRSLWPEIERRWRSGETAEEIAGALETTPANVRDMVQRMRRQGIDLPYRSTRKAAA